MSKAIPSAPTGLWFHGETLFLQGGEGTASSVWAYGTDGTAAGTQLLADVPPSGALLGGDFNAWPGTKPITLFQRSGRFNNACFEGPPTFPVDKPKHRIDFIVAPKAWRLVEQHVVKTDVSDHLPVVATFEMPEKSR